MVTGFLQINQAPLPSVYLGVPLFFGSTWHTYFNQILDSIRSRLAGCKTKCLSFASRLTLVKHVISSIPLRISLVIPLLRRICLQIERLVRNFLWSADPVRLRSNLVRWKIVCLPKSEQGLGLLRLKEFNEACLLKLAWSEITADSLWAKWFRARYFRGP